METISEETRNKIHQMCKDYIGGKWHDVSQNDLDIQIVPAGNVNKLYFCSLPGDIQEKYSKLVVRFTSDLEEFKKFTQQSEIIAKNVILSEKSITPKLLAVSSEGMINERISECRYFMDKDDRIDRRVRKLATKLADFHSLRMPLPKARNPFFDLLLDSEEPFMVALRTSYNEGRVRQAINELDLQTHKELHLLDEMRWLMDVIKQLDCPIIFSHNDFNRKNILIRETKDGTDEDIYIIDFDWTNYNYRGYDFGQYFCSWSQSEPEFGSGDFPSDQEMSVFISAYIKRMTEILGDSYAKRETNSLDQIIKEAKIFAMNAYFKDNFYFIWQVNNNPDDPQTVENLKIAEMRYRLYKNLKDKVLREYSDIRDYKSEAN